MKLIEHTCKHPITGGPVHPLYQGQTVKDKEMWFCLYCHLRLERVEDKFYIDPIEREYYEAQGVVLTKKEKKKGRKR